MKKVVLLLFALMIFTSCEKDDICDPATSTTPMAVIEFYNANNQTALKNVTNLVVIAPGFTEGFLFTGVNKIKVPLKTMENVTQLQFVENGGTEDTLDDNIDVVQFTYTTSDLFVSRACGFKRIFNLTNTNSNLITPDTDNWMTSAVITQPNIETENETHIKIYF
jgi:Family of unknown function (DUF6452)